MTVSYSALKNEIINDPNGLGYSTPYNLGNDDGVAALLNSVGAGAAYSIFKNSVPIADLLKNFVPAEFNALTAVQVAKLQLLFAGSATIDPSDANTRSIFQTFLSAATGTLTNFAALIKRQGSRAEVLFGIGTSISGSDVAAARNA